MAKHPTGYCPVFGNYPREYNRAVHGPYYPWVNYNPQKDLPLSEVKLGELKQWLGRRNKTPQAIMAAVSRSYFWWQRNWLESRFGAPSKGILQFMCALSLSSFIVSYGYFKMERKHKYHW